MRLNLNRRFWKIQWSWRPFLFGLCSYKHYVRFFSKILIHTCSFQLFQLIFRRSHWAVCRYSDSNWCAKWAVISDISGLPVWCRRLWTPQSRPPHWRSAGTAGTWRCCRRRSSPTWRPWQYWWSCRQSGWCQMPLWPHLCRRFPERKQRGIISPWIRANSLCDAKFPTNTETLFTQDPHKQWINSAKKCSSKLSYTYIFVCLWYL